MEFALAHDLPQCRHRRGIVGVIDLEADLAGAAARFGRSSEKTGGMLVGADPYRDYRETLEHVGNDPLTLEPLSARERVVGIAFSLM